MFHQKIKSDFFKVFAHLGSKYIVINFTIACTLVVLSHIRYMYMAQQMFVLKVWVISHGHILTEIMQKTKQNFITNF